MIKTLLSFSFALLTFSSFAQNDETPAPDSSIHWLVGADVQLTGEIAIDQFTYYGHVGLNSGYFISKNFLLGAEGVISISPSSRYYEAVPIARYYYFFEDSHHALYGGFRGGYGWGVDYSLFTDDTKGRYAWVWGARTGYLSRFNKHVALDIFAFYNERYSSSQRQDGQFTEPSMTAAFGIGLGFQVFL